MGPKARSEYNSRMRAREAERDRAADEIREYARSFPSQGVRVNRDSILSFLLWEEQGRECLYCQQPISQHQLFGGEADVDHILPYSRSLDDSQSNKVVAHRRCNHDKGQRTPYEWLAESNAARYSAVCQQAASLLAKGRMPYGKYRKFLQKELDLDTFVARQLADTGYIAKATAEYVRLLFDQPHDVLGLKGQHTAELRRQWGLNSVLRHDQENRKNREDHRHHAIDALVVALTNRARLQDLSQEASEVEWRDSVSGATLRRRQYTGAGLLDPWPDFRRDVEGAVNRVYVSHRAERKVAGALHEDTLYGTTPDPGIFVVRKPLESLSPNEIPLIRDDAVRGAVTARLVECGIDIGRGKKVDPKKWKQALCDEANPVLLPPSRKRLKKTPEASGVPIKKVRVLRKELTIQPIRDGQAYVKPGANHHLCIFEWQVNGKVRRDAVFVTQLEALNRIKNKQNVIQRTPPRNHPTLPHSATFVMSLCSGDMVLAEINGETRLMVVSTLVSTQKRIHLVDARDARRSSEKDDIGTTPNSLIEKYKARKVTVDPLGRIRWAND